MTNRITPLPDNAIFVFGSNESGRHGKGAARYALDRKGAVWGIPIGFAGFSYAIPTVDAQIRSKLPLSVIKNYVNLFNYAASIHPDMTFQVTRIGCGLAGHKDEDIAVMFTRAPENCLFDVYWAPWLPEKVRFWGTF